MLKQISRLAAAVIATWILAAPTALAGDVSWGLAGIEEGGDRIRPAVSLRLGADSVYADFIYWGRSFGPVREQDGIVSIGGRSKIHGDWLYACAGFSLLAEKTSIKGGGEDGENLSETSLAPGAMLGVGARVASFGGFRYDLQWNSHIFPAGGGGIFLANGRKQVFLLSGGVEL